MLKGAGVGVQGGRFEVELSSGCTPASQYQAPVVDQTGLTNSYDFSLKWKSDGDSNLAALQQALEDQLGLELVPTNMPVEMLVVEKTK